MEASSQHPLERVREHVLGRNGLDVLAVLRQLLVRQAMHGEPCQCAEHGAGCLEPDREDADEVIARRLELGVRDPLLPNAIELGEDVLETVELRAILG